MYCSGVHKTCNTIRSCTCNTLIHSKNQFNSWLTNALQAALIFFSLFALEHYEITTNNCTGMCLIEHICPNWTTSSGTNWCATKGKITLYEAGIIPCQHGAEGLRTSICSRAYFSGGGRPKFIAASLLCRWNWLTTSGKNSNTGTVSGWIVGRRLYPTISRPYA